MDKQNTKRNCKSNTKQIRTEKKKLMCSHPQKEERRKKRKNKKRNERGRKQPINKPISEYDNKN